MILVRRPFRGADADEPDDVRGRVGQRMKPVGQNADRAARIAEQNLRRRDEEIQEKHSDEDARDACVAIGRKSGFGMRDSLASRGSLGARDSPVR